MLEPGSALKQLLDNSAAITALRSTRMYPGEAPQGVSTPYQVYTRTSNDHDENLATPSGVTSASIQIDTYGDATEHDTVEDLADKTRIVLDGYRGTATDSDSNTLTILGCRLEDDDSFRIPPADGSAFGATRVRQDFRVSYREATSL